MTVARVAVAIGFLATDERAVLRAHVPTHAFLVVDATIRVELDHESDALNSVSAFGF